MAKSASSRIPAFVAALCLIPLVGCISVDDDETISSYRLMQGAILQEGPMDYLLSAAEDGGMALRSVGPFQQELVCRFSMKTDLPDGIRNGFLVLNDQMEPEKSIYAGIYIGAGEFAVEGPGVSKFLVVPVEFDKNQMFEVTVIVNFEKRFVEMQTKEREIGSSLAPHMRQVSYVGYKVNSTETNFSRIEVTGK